MSEASLKESTLEIRAKNVLAQGHTGTNSKRPTCFPSNYPTHLVKGQGAYVYDTKGTRYLDFICSLGANLLGYNHPKVTESVVVQLRKGVSFSLPHFLEVEVAEQITEMFPHIEKVRFLKTGNEATLAAVRIARAATKSTHVYVDGYHGWGDLWTNLTPPKHGVVDCLYSNSQPTGEIAIVEPIQLNTSDDRRRVLEEIIKDHKVVIFDEIITGLRVPKYSVGSWFNLKPHLTCLGKALGNGFPISVVGGTKELMDSDYFVSSTFSGEAVSLAACYATLNEVRSKGLDNLWYYANRFQTKFNEIGKAAGIRLDGYGTRAMLNVEEPNTQVFMQECLKGGIMFGKAFFFGFQHLEQGIEEYAFNIIVDVVEKIINEKVRLEGPAPVQTFKR